MGQAARKSAAFGFHLDWRPRNFAAVRRPLCRWRARLHGLFTSAWSTLYLTWFKCIWRFPERRVPPNHPNHRFFHYKTIQITWGIPIDGNPHMCKYRFHVLAQLSLLASHWVVAVLWPLRNSSTGVWMECNRWSSKTDRMQLCLLVSASRNLGKEFPIQRGCSFKSGLQWSGDCLTILHPEIPQLVDLIILLSEGATESSILAVSSWLQCTVPWVTEKFEL